MILIADSGTTKTDWVLLAEKLQHIYTQGFNPNYFPPQRLDEILQRELKLPDCATISRLFYYGSGCAAAENRRMIGEKLQKKFPDAQIEVQHDLLGTARSLCQKEAGIACILGTGSNSCAFDGEKITANVPSLGWILADYGSGTFIGKSFIHHYLMKDCPQELNDVFEAQYALKYDDIIRNIYREEGAGRFLGQFSRFVGAYIHHPFMENIVREAFEKFLKYQVLPYRPDCTTNIHFSGSVAVHFSDILRDCLKKCGLKPGVISQKPIEGLIKYHQNEQIF